MWTCPKCGQPNEDGLDECWRCADEGADVLTMDNKEVNIVNTLEQRSSSSQKKIDNLTDWPFDLTKSERKLAERAAKIYHRFFYRRSQLIIWIGTVFFFLGFPVFTLYPDWLRKLLSNAGFFLMMIGLGAHLMSIIGKLYDKVKMLDSQFNKPANKG